MAGADRLLRGSLWMVGAARLGNLALGLAMAGLVAITLADPGLLAPHLLAKYHGHPAPGPLQHALQGFCLVGLMSAWLVERLLAALATILRSVPRGLAFSIDNAARLRSIGWMLLALQGLDLVVGLAIALGRQAGIEVVSWRPSLAGWLSVLLAFVLARLFAAGSAMRDELAATV